MAPPYAQANESGYVVDVVEEELLVGLFGGRGKRIDEETAKAIRDIKRQGMPIRIEDVPEYNSNGRKRR
jgi:hypothetical protein